VLRVARNADQVLDETALFLHRPLASLAPEQRRLLDDMHQGTSLDGAKVLVVDDDIRNIFAVASALERQRATVFHAESGKDGLALLDEHPDVECVLMDIMMPEMDGYEVIRRIRAQERFRALPIIALTAKAMKADREKCTQAGASDYIAKPVDMARLLSMIRVCRRR
jgi:CheY-like chemotaxis protein